MIERDEIINRLALFGYKAEEGDYLAIDYESEKLKEYVLNFCNISELPKGLKLEFIDAVCANFLKIKLNQKALTGEKVKQITKTIHEGDTTITFDSSVNPEVQLRTYLDTLAIGLSSLVKYRRMVW